MQAQESEPDGPFHDFQTYNTILRRASTFPNNCIKSMSSRTAIRETVVLFELDVPRTASYIDSDKLLLLFQYRGAMRPEVTLHHKEAHRMRDRRLASYDRGHRLQDDASNVA